MSRSGYSNDCENWGLWRGAVASATRGKRGQRLLKDLAEAMDAMPEKKLIAHALKADEQFCALGVLGAKRGIDMDRINPEEYDVVARKFDIAEPLAQEIVYMNDEYMGYCQPKETPEERWIRMRKWVDDKIKSTPK